MNSESAGVSGQSEQTEQSPRKKKKKKVRGRITVIRERCKGCGYCVAFCPTDALEMSSDFNTKGYHYPVHTNGRDCNGCDLCGMYCPDFAINGTRLPNDESGDQADEE